MVLQYNPITETEAKIRITKNKTDQQTKIMLEGRNIGDICNSQIKF